MVESFLTFIFMNYISIIPEKAMAPHSRTLAWKIPWMEEPGRLQSMGSHGHILSLYFLPDER